MTRNLDRYDWLALALVALMFAAALWVQPTLPDRVPIRFNFEGHPNGWAPRSWGTLVNPVVAALLFVLLRLSAPLLPPAWRDRMLASPMSVAVLATVALLAAFEAIQFVAVSRPDQPIGVAMDLALGGYFVVFGQIVPKLRRNPWVGIRNAWTLSSDEVWARTHRMAGRFWTLAGLFAMVAGFFSGTVALVGLLTLVLAPSLYSFVSARQANER
jgi:uncharacterized membrane protein